ncbi:glycosyltransferase [Streptomyces sp. LP05-1]|uniref:Glycosyltransferase n=1 Tax=Streptomyces pyxinae TaxID=2970734 RepID=A0ABT2CC13_9ACTN|nr:glycosyltransferase [Streptomyces sp. LP05-1]MCS0634960.1 glycosyltransferase [Streptomyces sp. LP05-1]
MAGTGNSAVAGPGSAASVAPGRRTAVAVTVVTITRTRPALLARALASAQAQSPPGGFEHLVVADDCDDTHALLRGRELPGNVRWLLAGRGPGEVSGPGRSSRLRNMAVRVSESPWIAFLDDDNEWEPDHLASLLACARRTGHRAVHSQLRMFHPDGTPYLEPLDPWTADEDAARAEYARMRARGVVAPGTCVRRDRLDPLGTPDPVVSVDTGEWLLARELLLRLPFRDDFDAADEAARTGEDDKLAADLRRAREPVSCTGLPTLRYYLGGYSNNFTSAFDPTFSWRA